MKSHSAALVRLRALVVNSYMCNLELCLCVFLLLMERMFACLYRWLPQFFQI
ncbi:hypothetical protein LINPERHAP1_LOCUS43284 [Linum perenne]